MQVLTNRKKIGKERLHAEQGNRANKGQANKIRKRSKQTKWAKIAGKVSNEGKQTK